MTDECQGTATPSIPLDNDHEFIYRVRERDDDTGEDEVASELTGLTGYISLEDAGDPIAGTQVDLNERDGMDGEYFGILDRNALNTALSGKVGEFLYEIVARDGFVETSQPVQITRTRRPL